LDWRYVTIGNEKPVQLWDAEIGKAISTISKMVLSCMAFSPDGSWIVGSEASGVRDKSGSLVVWDRATGIELVSYASYNNGVTCSDVSQDGQRVVFGMDGYSHPSVLNVMALKATR
jgi:WD40 repeat protein